MSIILFVLGALSLIVGAGMVAYGIPINEFNFGNTLIIAGTVAIVGGLVLIGLGAAVRQLRQLALALAARPMPAQPARSVPHPDAVAESAAVPAPARMPQPPRPRAEAEFHEPAPLRPRAEPEFHEPPPPRPWPEPEIHEAPPAASTARQPYPAEAVMRPAPPPEAAEPEAHPPEPMLPEPRIPPRADMRAEQNAPSFAPLLRNPEAASPQPSTMPSAPSGFGAPRRPSAPAPERPESNFDALWSTEPKLGPGEPSSPMRPNRSARESAARPPTPSSMPNQSRSVAILKSGVVDGMAYTLYVDGSIEAELPQGLVRFASIDALRSHLEKN